MPAYVHGKNAYLSASIGSGSTVLTTDMNTITLTQTKSNPETTTFGDHSRSRVGGLNDATLTGAFVYSGDIDTASSLAYNLDQLMAASSHTPMIFGPAGNVSGCPSYTACWIINSLEYTAPLDGVVAGTFAFQLASGSIISGSFT